MKCFTRSENLNFISNVKSRCFWNILLFNWILMNKRLERSNFLVFLLNITFCTCLVTSEKKTVFQWKTQLLTAVKTLLKVAAIALTIRNYHQQKVYNLNTVHLINCLYKERTLRNFWVNFVSTWVPIQNYLLLLTKKGNPVNVLIDSWNTILI